MRKPVVISSIVVAVIVVAAVAGGLTIRHNNNQERAQEVAAAQQAEKLADWQNKVKTWNAEKMQASQSTTTNGSAPAASPTTTGLQQQGVDQLPKTGVSSNLLILASLATFAGYVFRQLQLRRTLG